MLTYVNCCLYVANSSFAFWNFVEFFFWISLLCGWLNAQMQSWWIWMADCTLHRQYFVHCRYNSELEGGKYVSWWHRQVMDL